MEADDNNNMSLRVASFSCYLDTAKESLVRRVSAQDPSTIKPPINIKFSKKDQDHGGLKNLRVDSFNSYLNTAPDAHNFVFEVPGPIQDPTSAFTFSHQIPKDGEIGVFGADKYFNMKLEYQTGTKTAYKINQAAAPANLGRNIMPTTPSLTSETTSWNSQRALLQGNESQMKQKKGMTRRLFMGFGCRGPCFDKKSVHVDETEGFYTSKPSRTGSERHGHPPIPALAPPLNLAAAAAAEAEVEAKTMMKIEDLDQSRPSIEVFGSLNRSVKGDTVATNMERKLSMLTWDAIPKGRNLPTSRNGTSTVCDDMASDASSDLFEIENISGSIFPLLAADDDDIDTMSNCMSPTTSHYAPSEASIQWSVVTASAADYSFNDESVSVAGDAAVSKKVVVKRGKEVQKVGKAAGGFLGCKSHKAVDVAEKNDQMIKAKNINMHKYP